VKVHPGQLGQMHITNIRLIWYFPKAPWVNVSIGYRTIQNSQITKSVQNGTSIDDILFIRCKEGTKTYEFAFGASRAQKCVFRFFEFAIQNYDSSTLLREQKLRTALLEEGKLILMNNEQVIIHLDGVANFSGEVAKFGIATVTNYRFVWCSEIVMNFNVSIPLILLPELKLAQSKRYGKCLYLRLFSNGIGFLYGFTLQPEQRLVEFVTALERIRAAAARLPLLTPPISTEPVIVGEKMSPVEEDCELLENDPTLRYIPCDIIGSGGNEFIVYDATLGLAIESLPDGETLSERWMRASNTPLVDVDDL
jgi:hypothetical protein